MLGRYLDLERPVSQHPDNHGLTFWLDGFPQLTGVGGSATFWPDLVGAAETGPRFSTGADFTNAPAWDTAPPARHAVRFNGSSQYATLPTAAIPTAATRYTVAARVKFAATDGVILAYRNSGDSTPIMWQLDVSGGSVRMLVRDDTGNIANANGGTVTTGRWYDVVGVRDGSNVYAYLDGVQVGTASNTFGTINAVNNSLLAATNAGGLSSHLNCTVASVRLATRAWSAAEVARNSLWSANPSADPRVGPFTRRSAVLGGAAGSLDFTATGGYLPGRFLDLERPVSGHPDNDGLQLWLPGDPRVPFVGIPGQLSLLWPDASGSIKGGPQYLTGGVGSNGPVWAARGNGQVALSFNGTNQHADLGTLPDVWSRGVTVAAWIRQTAAAGQYRSIVSTRRGSDNATPWATDWSNNDRLRFYVNNGGFSVWEGTTVMGPDQYYRVVFSYDGVTAPSIYANGVAQAVTNTGGGPVPILYTATPWRVGAFDGMSGGDSPWAGQLADIRVLNRPVDAGWVQRDWAWSRSPESDHRLNTFRRPFVTTGSTPSGEAVGSAAGSTAVAGVSNVKVFAVGAAAGSSAVAATAVAKAQAVGAVAGATAVAALSPENDEGVGSITGAATIDGIAFAKANAVGAVAGSTAVAATGRAKIAAVGSVTGSTAVAATGVARNRAAGSVSGSSTVSGTTNAKKFGVGSVSGASAVAGVGRAKANAVGAATGSSLVNATSTGNDSLFQAAGSTAVAAVAVSKAFAVGSSSGSTAVNAASSAKKFAVGTVNGSSSVRARSNAEGSAGGLMLKGVGT